MSERPGLDADPEAQTELADLREQRDLLAESQRVNVTLMDHYNLETAELRQGIISSTGKISQDILDKDVAAALFEEWTADATDWVRTNGAALVFQLVMFLLVLLAFWFLARIAKGTVRRALDRSRVGISSLARDFFIKSTGRMVMLLGVIIAIAQLGIEVGPLLAGLGIAGFVVGFALQDTLSNFASGMMILIYRPFDVGDVIEAGGVSGKVHEMNLVSTMVLTFDNQLLVVPNKQIWGGVIRNVTHQSKRRVDMTFGIGYSGRHSQSRASPPGDRRRTRQGVEGSGAGDSVARARRLFREFHRSPVVQDRRLLGCVLGCHPRSETTLRRGRDFDSVPAARRPCLS